MHNHYEASALGLELLILNYLDRYEKKRYWIRLRNEHVQNKLGVSPQHLQSVQEEINEGDCLSVQIGPTRSTYVLKEYV